MNAQTPSEIRSVCVYCGSSAGDDPAFIEAASDLGKLLATNGLRLVYGGGDNGLMGAVARATLENGGQVLGIIPTFLKQLEQGRGTPSLEGATMLEVPDMHTRKHQMFEHADAFVALPGGIGTLEEIVEIMTWAQLRRHAKPMVVLDINSFWQPFQDLLTHMQDAGFLHNPAAATPAFVQQTDDVLRVIQNAAQS